MKMTRTYDDEQDEIRYSITNFDFTAVIHPGSLPPHLRSVMIADRGGVVESDVVPLEQVERRAKKMLFDFYKGVAA